MSRLNVRRPPVPALEMLAKESADDGCDLGRMCFQREMAALLATDVLVWTEGRHLDDGRLRRKRCDGAGNPGDHPRCGNGLKVTVALEGPHRLGRAR